MEPLATWNVTGLLKKQGNRRLVPIMTEPRIQIVI
jgi:hypothetical protein